MIMIIITAIITNIIIIKFIVYILRLFYSFLYTSCTAGNLLKIFIDRFQNDKKKQNNLQTIFLVRRKPNKLYKLLLIMLGKHSTV